MAGIGGPPGNNYAGKAKRWSEAIERAIEAFPEQPDISGCTPFMVGLNNAAHEFVAKLMEERDIQFFREFGDRLEGKPHQCVDLANPDGTGLFERLERIIIEAASKEK
jgi:hypothetical protein